MPVRRNGERLSGDKDMIKWIKARNFLSLREIDLELGPRNVLVGANMSGKSNLIECLKFVQEAAGRQMAGETTPLQQALLKRGGFSEVVWKGQLQGPISLFVMADLPGFSSDGPTSYCYEVSLRLHEYGHLEVETEKLTAKSAGKSKTILENSGGRFKLMDGGRTSEGPQNTLGLTVEQLGRYGSSSEGSRFWDFLMNWRFYHLVPALMRQSNPPSWEKYLFERGENLSAWLLTLQNQAEEFRRIKQACCDVLPGLGEILFQPVESPKAPVRTGDQTFAFTMESAKISVGASETHFKKPISLARMSDGELAFLALISVILAPEDLSPSLLCIEEPENYLHPRLIEVLVELLNQRATETNSPQLLATTHSPLFVDKLTINELVVAEKVNGATRFIHPSTKKHLRDLLSRKEISLGDLWYSGALSDS